MKTTWIVTGGLVLICTVALVVSDQLITLGALTSLAGWLGGNANGHRDENKTIRKKFELDD
ncbi:unnamed protein product [marine sediment metagenome]|uniref:Uncharacterized protein n=1 Tax=marine sediment metagenome TaxID=412755 RepID=X1KDG5_9ZZZZ